MILTNISYKAWVNLDVCTFHEQFYSFVKDISTLETRTNDRP
jgi:hypothetical protein